MSVMLVDMNNLAMIFIHTKDVKTVDKKTKKVLNIDFDYWKYLMFTSIYNLMYKEKGVKEVVLAIDARNSWRYDIWPRYKEDRKKKRKKATDDFPWDSFYKEYGDFMDDIKTHLPIKVIQIDRCEADDVIGIIAKNNGYNKSCIVSTDKDFLQLSGNNAKIYNPIKREFLSHPNPTMFLTEQCLIGQSKDSIFNIKTPLDWPEGKRKPGFGPKAFEKVVEYGIIKWLNDNNLMERFKFNQLLMSFGLIPDDIKTPILDCYNDYVYPDPSMIWEFIKKYNWPEYIDNFTRVEDKLCQLY